MSETVRLVLRLPAEVHEAVKALAAADRRSLNGEIVYILEQYVAERGGPADVTARQMQELRDAAEDAAGDRRGTGGKSGRVE